MDMFKPRGKHAQGAHADPNRIWSENAEGEEAGQAARGAISPEEAAAIDWNDVSPLVEAAAKAPSSQPSDSGVNLLKETPSKQIPEVRLEDYINKAPTAEPSGKHAVADDAGLTDMPAASGIPATQDASASGDEPVANGAPSEQLGSTPYTIVTMTPDGVALHKKHRPGKVIGITFGIIIGVLLVAYIAGAVVFMNMFLPKTTIVGNDISFMTNEAVAKLLDDAIASYAIDVTGDNGFKYRATADEMDLSTDSTAVVEAMRDDLNAWKWPVLVFEGAHDESSLMVLSFRPTNYDYKVVNAVSAFNKDAVAPVDATIAYSEKTKKFEIVPEKAGTQYDSHVILAAMQESIEALEPTIKLDDGFLVQPNVFSTDKRLVDAAEMATGLVSSHVTLTMGGQTVAEITGDNLSQFVRIDEAMGVTLDEMAIDEWVTSLSNGFDTVGTERTYTRPDGKVITISGGDYGWITDAPALKDEIIEAIKTGQASTIDIPCEQEAATYKGAGQPDWGDRYIDVDLSEQYVRFYDKGEIIWEAACISGAPDGKHDTWPGVWYITNKESPSKLVGYTDTGQKEYETMVQFWMAFEGNGIGLHDATWQPAFGGEMYAQGYGSHGCVNLSYYDAETLYSICELGDPVIAHF